MIQVNLIPVRAQKRRENVRQFISAYFLSVILLLSVMAYLWVSFQTEIRGLERRSTQLAEEVEQYAKYDMMLKELKEKKAVIEKKRAIIKELQSDRDKVVRMLALLSVELPTDKVWFERLTLAGNGITLNGVALSNVQGSVNLVLSRQVSKTNMKLREFQLSCKFMPFSAVQDKLNLKKTVKQPDESTGDKT